MLTPLEALCNTLQYSHLSPTHATLPTNTFESWVGDPFVMNERPDFYFAANQDRFEESSSGVFTIPTFSQTHECVVVDLDSSNVWCENVRSGSGAS